MEILEPRDVPLGGLRAMSVRRTLPQRSRRLIGPWCFLDHYGPDDLSTSDPMVVPPHPHTGLATVSWLFSGSVEHRDSAGHHAFVRPGEVNLMTAGRGISHSEYSTDDTTVLHGAQLWLALPDARRDTAPRFDHHAPEPVAGPGWEARVFLGSLFGSASPVPTDSPLVGAEIRLQPGAALQVPIEATHEHGVLLDSGDLTVDGEPLAPHRLGYRKPGTQTLSLRSDRGALLLLIGGAPFGEQIVMWWNFIGRSHDEVVAYRAQWEHLLANGSDDRFGLPEDDPLPPLHAPVLPNARLRLRG
ncbi:MAG: pirin family protein [Marmoricola sp.]